MHRDYVIAKTYSTMIVIIGLVKILRERWAIGGTRIKLL